MPVHKKKTEKQCTGFFHCNSLIVMFSDLSRTCELFAHSSLHSIWIALYAVLASKVAPSDDFSQK
jgi:hypothetical protein